MREFLIISMEIFKECVVYVNNSRQLVSIVTSSNKAELPVKLRQVINKSIE